MINIVPFYAKPTPWKATKRKKCSLICQKSYRWMLSVSEEQVSRISLYSQIQAYQSQKIYSKFWSMCDFRNDCSDWVNANPFCASFCKWSNKCVQRRLIWAWLILKKIIIKRSLPQRSILHISGRKHIAWCWLGR